MSKKTGNVESVGKEGTSKYGKTLSEEGKVKKKITFKEEKEESIAEELRKVRERVQEELKKIKRIKESLKECIRDMEMKEKAWEVRLNKIEEKIGNVEKDMEEIKQRYSNIEEGRDLSEVDVTESRGSSFKGSSGSII